MIIRKLICTCVCLFSTIYRECSAVNYTDFLISSRSQVNKMLESRMKIIENNIDVEPEIMFHEQPTKPEITSMYRNSRIFDYGNILIGPEAYTLIVEPEDKHFAVHKKSNIVTYDTKADFKVMEIIFYKKHGYMFIIDRNDSESIKQSMDDGQTWLAVQIFSEKMKTQAARFFTNQGNLYLILINVHFSSRSIMRMYKFIHNYFDEVEEAATVTDFSRKILTFSFENQEIIIIGTGTGILKMEELGVFIFNGKFLKRIQTILVQNASNTALYTFNHDHILVTIANNTYSQLHRWTGHSFEGWLNFDTYNEITAVFSTTFTNVPIILVFQKAIFHVYTHVYNGLTLTKTYKLGRVPGSIQDVGIIPHLDEVMLMIIYEDRNEFKLWFSLYTIDAYYKKREESVFEDTELKKYFSSLEMEIKQIDDHLRSIEQQPHKIINEKLEYKDRRSNNKLLNLDFENMVKENVMLVNTDHMIELDDLFNRTIDRIDRLKVHISDLHRNGDTVNGIIIVKGNLVASNTTTRNLNFQKLNNRTWRPQSWLTYNKAQTITGPFKIKSIYAKNLNVSDNMHKVLTALVSTKPKSSLYELRSLTARNVYFKEINNIPFEDIFLRSKHGIIKGIKSVHLLKSKHLKGTVTYKKNTRNLSEMLLKHQKVDKPLQIKQLNVEDVNNVNWEEFSKVVFYPDSTNYITGNLKILPNTFTKIKRLHAKLISNLDVSTFLTTSTNQRVTSKLLFDNVDCGKLYCSTVNDVRLEKEAVTPQNNLIKGPISIDSINIIELLIGYNISDIDTNETKDFLHQTYKRKVILDGNLYIKNIELPKTVTVNGKAFLFNELSNYWSKSKHQVITHYCKFLNGITVPHLQTNLLNGVPLSQFMLTDTKTDLYPINIVFQNVNVKGNIKLDDNYEHTPNFKDLKKNCVRVSGGSYSLYGSVSVAGKVTVAHLTTQYLDKRDISNAITTNYSGKIKGYKFFKNLVIKNHLASQNISTLGLNDYNIKDIKKTALYINKPANITKMVLNITEVHNLQTTFINGQKCSKYLDYWKNTHNISELSEVRISSNIILRNITGLVTINEYELINLIPQDIDQTTGVISIYGDIQFSAGLYADLIHVININNVYFPSIMNKILYREWDQTITGVYTFDHLNTENIYCPSINNVSTQYLINKKSLSPQTIDGINELRLLHPRFENSLYVDPLQCNIDALLLELKNINQKNWDKVYVSKDIILNAPSGKLHKLLNYAVHARDDNVITGKVTFNNDISVKNVNLEKYINGINASEILIDAVLKNRNQVVTGTKRFHHLKVYNAKVVGNAAIPIVNGNDIKQIYDSIVGKDVIFSGPIKAKKIFTSGMEAYHLFTAKISGISPNDIATTHTNFIERPLSSTYFKKLEIKNNFYIDFVNNLKMKDFLDNRIVCGPFIEGEQDVYGAYEVEEIEVNNDANVSTLNNVDINEAVFDDNVPDIFSEKIFRNSVSIHDNVSTVTLNGIDLNEAYKHAIIDTENQAIYGNIKFNNLAIVHGNVITDKINGISVTDLNKLAFSPEVQNKAKSVSIAKEIDYLLHYIKITSRGLPDTYLYLEKLYEVNISFKNIIHAKYHKVGNIVVLSVIRQEKGFICGLPNSCSCPVQDTIQITEHSVSVIVEGTTERNYSFENEELGVHVLTKSVSSSEECRINTSTVNQELTSVVWINHIKKKVRTPITNLTGYISDIEFFYDHYNNASYMIACRFYDPLQNSYQKDCLVFEISRVREEIRLTQRLSVTRAWRLHLFYTTQGPVLIIGSNFNPQRNDASGIQLYRFDSGRKQFILFQNVWNINCTAAVGVAVKSDSLIIIAVHNGPLQVYKYHPLSKLYYFYQSIYADALITGISAFYIGEYGISNVYLCIVSNTGMFYVYSFKHLQGWKVVSSGKIEGLQNLIPYKINNNRYIFAASSKISYVLSIVKHGYH